MSEALGGLSSAEPIQAKPKPKTANKVKSMRLQGRLLIGFSRGLFGSEGGLGELIRRKLRIQSNIPEIILADEISLAMRLFRFAFNDGADLEPILFVDKNLQLQDSVIFLFGVVTTNHIASPVAGLGDLLFAQATVASEPQSCDWPSAPR